MIIRPKTEAAKEAGQETSGEYAENIQPAQRWRKHRGENTHHLQLVGMALSHG